MKFCPGVPFLVPRCRTVYTQSPISDPPRHSFFAFGSCPSPPNLVGIALPKIRNRETPSFQSVGSKHSRFGFVDWDRGATSRVRQLFLRHSLFLAELAQNISKRPFWLTGSGGNRSTAWLGVILASSTTRRRVRFATGHERFQQNSSNSLMQETSTLSEVEVCSCLKLGKHGCAVRVSAKPAAG